MVAGISFGLLAIVAALGPMDTLHTLTLVRRLAYFGLVAVLEVPVIFAFGFFVLYVLRDRRLVYLARTGPTGRHTATSCGCRATVTVSCCTSPAATGWR